VFLFLGASIAAAFLHQIDGGVKGKGRAAIPVRIEGMIRSGGGRSRQWRRALAVDCASAPSDRSRCAVSPCSEAKLAQRRGRVFAATAPEGRSRTHAPS